MAVPGASLPAPDFRSGDTLVLEGMEFYGYHGNDPAERALGGRLRVDVVVSADLQTAGLSDALDDTIDYAACFASIREIVENRQFNLLEALAEAIATTLLGNPRALAVDVRVAKTPPLPGHIRGFAVRVQRARTAATSS